MFVVFSVVLQLALFLNILFFSEALVYVIVFLISSAAYLLSVLKTTDLGVLTLYFATLLNFFIIFNRFVGNLECYLHKIMSYVSNDHFTSCCPIGMPLFLFLA